MAEEKKQQVEQTLGLIKPDSFSRADEVISRLLKEGFTVVDKRQVVLTKQRTETFYGEHKGKGFFDELVAFMASGPIYALKLEKEDAIKAWRALMGPTKYEVAKKEAPDSLRALFATDTTKNAVHGSDSTESAQRELDFFFNTQQTLGLIKPDAVANGKSDEMIQRIENEGFLVVDRQSVTLTKEKAEAFYAEHAGKGFFDELVEFMCSGPTVAMKLEKKNGIKAWRDLMGPTNYEVAKKEAPNSLRALYATNMTKNASHGSDSVSSAVRELEFWFPQQETLALIKPDAVSAGNATKIMQRIVQDGFTILESQKLRLDKERAQSFYIEHKDRGFYGELVDFMVSGDIYALKLRGMNGIAKWRELMGPTNFEEAKQQSPNSIRALYASNMTQNASHGSDSVESASRELEFFFPTKSNESRNTKQYTLALIKPDVVAKKEETNVINRIKYEGFAIIQQKKLQLTKERAEAFYGEHKGKGFFEELVTFMTSGELIALKLEKENAIKSWRSVMGPTKFEVAQKEAPDSIRGLFATNTTKNAAHGSDSTESAKRELNFFFV
eukprot:174673_1